VGQLYEFAEEKNTNKVVIDVFNEDINPSVNKFGLLCRSHLEVTKSILKGCSLGGEWLEKVLVLYEFEVPYIEKYHYFGSALGGKPSLCSVEITADNGHVYSAELGCNVWVHNPKTEHRRYGF